MRQVMVRVPEGGGGQVLEMAEERGAVNVSRWQVTGRGGQCCDMVLAHLSNAAVGPFADDLEALDGVHVSFLTSDALALRPPADEIAGQTRDVTLQAPLEIYLAGL